MNSELTLACVVLAKIAKRICWCKGFLPLRSKLSEPIASNNDEDNGKPEKKKMQPANLIWWKWLFHSPCIYNQWWDEHRNKTISKTISQLLCEKSDVSYGGTSAWIKRQISFSLLRTSIICIRGLRSKKYNILTGERMDIVCVCIWCVYIYVYGCILIYVCIYIIYICV